MKNAIRLGLALCLAVVAAVVGQAVATAGQQADSDRPVAATVVTYDASGSPEFTEAVARGASMWNQSVANVQLRPAAPGQQANVRVVTSDGWPMAYTSSLGNGTVYIGRQAITQGYDPIRVAAHEFGHILGLPDVKPGPCSSLMSGSSAGASCASPYPDARERQQVESAFGTGGPRDGEVLDKPIEYHD